MRALYTGNREWTGGLILHKALVQQYKLSDRNRLTTGCVPRRKRGPTHTPSIAFRHRPPNSARNGYAIERTLFISAQLSADAVIAFRKVWVLIKPWKHHRPKYARKKEARLRRVKIKQNKKLLLDSNVVVVVVVLFCFCCFCCCCFLCWRKQLGRF